MTTRERFQQAREVILKDMMRFQVSDEQDEEFGNKKYDKFQPTKIRIGGVYYGTNRCGKYIFKNRKEAKNAITSAINCALSGTVLNSEGIYEPVRGLNGVIKVFFSDVYIKPDEVDLLKSQFMTYFFSSIKFEDATLKEFLENNHRVTI